MTTISWLCDVIDSIRVLCNHYQIHPEKKCNLKTISLSPSLLHQHLIARQRWETFTLGYANHSREPTSCQSSLFDVISFSLQEFPAHKSMRTHAPWLYSLAPCIEIRDSLTRWLTTGPPSEECTLVLRANNWTSVMPSFLYSPLLIWKIFSFTTVSAPRFVTSAEFYTPARRVFLNSQL